jgi:hypothetical protein
MAYILHSCIKRTLPCFYYGGVDELIITRKEFKNQILQWFPAHPEMADADSVVWFPEHDKITCHWFVAVAPIKVSQTTDYKQGYWDWCNKNINGHVRCFMSDSDHNQEWWGFTKYTDIPWWMLRWSV